MPEGPRPFNARLQILGTLGSGAMGTVYRAHDAFLQRDVALKVLHLDSDPKVLARFEREAKVMGRIQHPACVAIHEAGVQAGLPYLVLELVGGGSLTDRIREASPQGLDPNEVATWGRQLAEGLAACHAEGVIHRDIKPDNILIDERGRARLTDFGIALDDQERAKLTLTGTLVGTVSYMPPEQLAGHPCAGSDLYALGASLYEALTGSTPFEAASLVEAVAMITKAPPRPARTLRPDLSPDLDAILLRCLAKRPQGRYPDAETLADDLNRYLTGAKVDAAPRASRALPAALLGLAVLLAIALTAALATRTASTDPPGQPTKTLAAIPSPTTSPTPPYAPAPDPTPSATSPPAQRLDQKTRDLNDARYLLGLGPLQLPASVRWVEDREYEHLPTGTRLIWVPRGMFRMGADPAMKNKLPEEEPVHRVTITQGFFIGRFEATWAQYRRFCAETSHSAPNHRIGSFRAGDEHPVFRVTWNDASAYCRWAGLRLPTEAEWEFAARGRYSVFAWPFAPDTKGLVANLGDVTALRAKVPGLEQWRGLRSYNDTEAYTARVGSYPQGRSPWQCHDMAGNVFEWVQDWFGPYAAADAVDPTGPPRGTRRVLRGGSYKHGDWASRSIARLHKGPASAEDDIGFRVALSAPRITRATAFGLEILPDGTFRNPRDGSLLTYVPPEPFVLGNQNANRKNWEASELPSRIFRHERGFFIGIHEVTFAQYDAFCRDQGLPLPARTVSGTNSWGKEPALKAQVAKAIGTFQAGDDHPVFSVSWAEAVAYCRWAGLRLPRETEWEQAARGSDNRTYPWGFRWLNGGRRRANVSQAVHPEERSAASRGIFQLDEALFTRPTIRPRGPISDASPFGCLDMAGNVNEWTADWLAPYPGGKPLRKFGKFVAPRSERVVRGGSWNESAWGSRACGRNGQRPDSRNASIGFRVARDYIRPN